MAFPSTLPLYLRFYEHGHAVTFIRQRLMSRLNDSLGCEILFDNPAIIFPPLFFSFSLPSSKNRVFQIRIGNGETDKRNVEPYLAALFFFFFFSLSISATKKIISLDSQEFRHIRDRVSILRFFLKYA